MSEVCARVHELSRAYYRYSFPFNGTRIPDNGLYLLFEKGEKGHGGDRIVRVGTHTGENQLAPRLEQHFLNENKDRSIFRKNIGRALLASTNDPFIKYWELDLTTKAAREEHEHSIDLEYQAKVEAAVSKYIRKNFSFMVFEIPDKSQRMTFESKFISTVSLCTKCRPSSRWLGLDSPKQKICASGLWLVNQLYKTPFELSQIEVLRRR